MLLLHWDGKAWSIVQTGVKEQDSTLQCGRGYLGE